MNFIGIDLSWRVSPPKPLRTATAVLNERYELIADALLSSDEDIIEFIKRHSNKECIVGIDAPLILPPKLKQRECERQLLSCGIAVFPGNRDWFFRAFGGVRGETLVEKLKRLNIPLKDFLRKKERTNALLEVYPYSAWKVLFGEGTVPKYKNTTRLEKIKGLTGLRRKLFSLSPPLNLKIHKGIEHRLDCDISRLNGKALDRLSDLLDALISAYILLVYWHYGDEKCVVIGDLEEGFILTLANECLRKMAYKRNTKENIKKILEHTCMV